MYVLASCVLRDLSGKEMLQSFFNSSSCCVDVIRCAVFCHENRKECTFGNEMLFERGILHANSVNYARLKSVLLINAWPIVEIGIPASNSSSDGDGALLPAQSEWPER